MHQTLKVKEERREPELEIEPEFELQQEQELAHLHHEQQEQQQRRDKQQQQQQSVVKSVEMSAAAESKEIISPIKQEEPPLSSTEMEENSAASRSSNQCAGCREPIRDKFIFSVIDLNWHQDCVQCADCLLKLNERCHTYDGKLYCRQDYWRRFGPKCFACKESIERNELVQIIKGNRIYHLKCFTCSECNKQLKAGEQLHLIDGKRLLCKQDYHNQIAAGCKSPANYPPSNNNNNNNNNSKSCFQTQATSLSSQQQQSQQHTISASTYYTLMSNQGNQKQGSEQKQVQEQGSIRRAANNNNIKIERRQQQNASLSGDEADLIEMEGGGCFEEELEAEEEADTHGVDEVELVDEEGGASLDDEMRSLLGFEANNNLENEENRSGLVRFSRNDPIEQQQQQQQHPSNANRSRKAAARMDSIEGEVKRRRRRRKKLQTAGGGSSCGGSNATGLKRLTNRNGESILNGMPPASSILAVHSGSSSLAHHPSAAGGDTAAAMTAVASLQPGSHHQHHNQLLQPSNHLKSVPSSAASTASDSSTSSSMSLSHQGSNHGSSHPHQKQHHNHQRQHQHHHQLQQQQHQQSQPHNQPQQQQHQRSASGQSGGGHKPTRVRTVLNEKQLQTLRDCYAHNPRPDALMKEQLVEMTGLSSRVIRVWFQNKRCKDKKKSIQHRQMLQYERDGRHLAGLTLMRGVPMVASSPIQYDDHSTVSSTPGLTQQQQAQSQSGTTMLELQSSGAVMQQSGRDSDSSPLMAEQQQSNRPGHFAPDSVLPPAGQQQQPPQPVDIHAYQPPWKNLIEYANHGATPPERLNTASPRYQQLIGQIHGYNSTTTAATTATTTTTNRTDDVNQAEQTDHQHSSIISMAELQPQSRGQFHQPCNQAGMGFSNSITTNTMEQQQQQPLSIGGSGRLQSQQPPMGHLHQFQH